MKINGEHEVIKTSEMLLEANRQRGMALRETIAMVAVISLLISVHASSLAGGHRATEAEACLNNHRRLVQAWLMYVDDNRGMLVPNNGNVGTGSAQMNQQSWVSGWLDFTTSFDNVNRDYLVASDQTGYYGMLGPYLRRDVSLFRCPADVSSTTIFGRNFNRVRSVSINNWMAGLAWNGNYAYRVYSQMPDISDPSSKFVTTDERPDSINDSMLLVDANQDYIVDFPGAYHSGGTWLSFADGHVEYHRWTDSRTIPDYNTGTLLSLNIASPGNADMIWLRERATEPASVGGIN